MLRRRREPSAESPTPAAPSPGEMALDTLVSVVRALAEFALEQEETDVATFREEAEAWARHLALAAPAPGAPPGEDASPGARRDWEGVRRFVREYCRSSTRHAATVAADLRDVVWVFVRNFSQAFAQDEETDERIREQIARLERLVAEGAPAELKREVTEAVGALSRHVEERRERQRQRMVALGDTVRTLGDELETARREGEIDPLTRVHNRKAFDTYLEGVVEMHRAFHHPACLLLADVDRFKEVNDGSGHAAGDQVLRAVADAIVKVFLRKNDFVARFGGDEFAVVLRETALSDGLALAERLIVRVRALRLPTAARTVSPTLSVGVAALEPGDDARSWFERADRGLYAAKAAGRDRAVAGAAAPPAPPAPGQPGDAAPETAGVTAAAPPPPGAPPDPASRG